MFFYAKNLTEQTLHSGLNPWDFKLTEVLTAQIRGDKQERQNWYKNVSTDHYFYTLVEPANPNIRPSKNNPPFRLHGFAVDYDAKIPEARVTEVMESFPHKPSWLERSLGGNMRLVWLFDTPLRVETYEFCNEILHKARKWLNLDLLPGLDEPAFTDPTRLLCNGCNWRTTGVPHIDPAELQAFFVECGKEHRFRPSDANEIPLDIVEKEIISKFPGFVWPGEFVVGSQGPSFWVPGSVSANSAIVKPTGMFTFAAHAERPFYSWSDILGVEFIKQFAVSSIAHATADIWYDGNKFWMRDGDSYRSNKEKDLLNFLKVNCNLSTKPGKDGKSPVDQALNHLIHGPGRIVGAAPFIFYKPGIVDYQGEKKLNISNRKVMQPADELTPWGPDGKFPWLSAHFDRFFATADQLIHFLAWWKVFYQAGLFFKPYPGQNVFFMGGVNVGKTLTARVIIALSVGGFCDASEYLIQGGGFNSQLLEVPLWCCDDETMAESSAAQNVFLAMLKKCAANPEHLYSKKYEVPCMVDHSGGRIISTSNLDYLSNKTIGSLDNSSLDKTHLFLCAKENTVEFPDRYQLMEIITRELPYLLRWLLEWTPPAECIPDARYGYKAYHHPALIDLAHQSSKAAPFKELLAEALVHHFYEHPEDEVWKGSETAVHRLIHHHNPMNEHITRTLRMEQISRYLEMIQREGIIKCEVQTGEMKTKIWVFKRKDFNVPSTPKPPQDPPTEGGKTIFEK